MELSAGCEEVNEPLYDTISVSPSFIDDNGDIFQCGRCKQNFYSIVDFLTHKKEHMNEEGLCHYLNTYPTNAITLSQLSNEIWVLKENEHRDESQNNLLDSTNGDVLKDEQIFFQHDLINETDNLQSNSSILITDKETEESVNPLSCFSCGGCFETDAELSSHTQQTHNEPAGDNLQELTCLIQDDQIIKDVIDAEYTTENTASQMKYSQCVVCGRTFSNKFVLKRHLRTHMVWPDGMSKTLPKEASADDITFECPFCHQILKTFLQLRSHLKSHQNYKVFKCIQQKCAAMFVDLDSLNSHININHNLTEYHCYKCEIVLPSLEEIAKHQQSHLKNEDINKKKLSCIYCKAVFRRKDNLKHHLETSCHVHKCKYCDKSFANERSLRKHLIQHKSTSYKCQVCNVSFKLKHYLSSHLLTHNQERQFSCNVCCKEFKRKDLLVRHIKIHQPEKRKHCPYRDELGCVMEFTRMDKLKEHLKTHFKKFNNKINKSSLEIIVLPK